MNHGTLLSNLGALLSVALCGGCMTAPTDGGTPYADRNAAISFAGFLDTGSTQVRVKARNHLTGTDDLIATCYSSASSSLTYSGIRLYTWAASKPLSGDKYWKLLPPGPAGTTDTRLQFSAEVRAEAQDNLYSLLPTWTSHLGGTLTEFAEDAVSPDTPWATVSAYLPCAADATCAPYQGVCGASGQCRAAESKRTAVILANAPGEASAATAAGAANLIFSRTNPTSLRNFYYRSSLGRVDVVGKTGAEGGVTDVYGPYTVNELNPNCTLAPAVFSAVGDSVPYTSYEHVIILATAASGCGNGGLTYSTYTVQVPGAPKTVRASIIYNDGFADGLQDGYPPGVLLHEYGHQLGRDHGAGFECGAKATSASGCSGLVYLDTTDTMGGGDGEFNPVQKERLGWLTSGRIKTVTASGSYALNVYEDGLENTKVLKIPRKLDANGTPVGFYHLSFRKPPVFNRWLASTNFAGGIAVHIDEPAHFDGELLDTTPGSIAGTKDFSDAALTVGASFADPLAGVSFSFSSATASAAQVSVTVTPRTSRFVQVGIGQQFGEPVPNATVLGAGSYPFGTPMALTPVAPAGYTFDRWLDSSGKKLSSSSPLSLPGTADTFVWAIFKPAPPANDSFAAAMVVTLPSQTTSYTKGATTEPGEPTSCNGKSYQATVWYKLTAASAQTVTVNSTKSDYGTVLQVYTGATLGSLTSGGCVIWTSQMDPVLSFQTLPGLTYYVQVGALNTGQNLAVSFSATP